MIGVAKIGVAASRGGSGAPSVNTDFVSTWDTTQAGSASDTVVLPLLSGGTYSGTIDWGDGGATSTLSYANRTHVYAASGTYTITISGTIEGWQFNNGGDKLKITGVSNCGTLNLTTNGAFYGCSNLVWTATDAPIISTTTLDNTFYKASALGTANFNSWDVSSVQTFGLFIREINANASVDQWTTTALTNIGQFARDNDSFDQDLSGWDITLMTGAFNFMRGATGLSTVNYDATLVGWEATLQAAYPGGSGYTATINIHFGGSQYSSALMNVGEARYNLINVFGWTITDGGGV